MSERRIFTLLVEMRCNSFCVFCGSREIDEALVRNRRRLGLATPVGAFASKAERYTLVTATAALARARADGYTEVSFQGGEPTIFPEIVPLIRAAAALSFEFVGLVTNGRRLADAGFARAVMAAGLDGLTFSLLGPDAETHDALAAAPGSFDELVRGIDNCVALLGEAPGPRLSATLVTSARTIDRLGDELTLLAEHGVRTAGVHLLKFDELAREPKVEAALRFDPARLPAALAAARATAARVGIRLNLAELPLCQQGGFDHENLELRTRDQRIVQHSFAGHARDREHRPRAHFLDGCADCLVAGSCAGFAVDAIPPAAEPITAGWMTTRTRAALASPGDDALMHAVDQRRALAALEPFLDRPTSVDDARRAVDETLGALLVGAVRRREARAILTIGSALLGLAAPRDPAAWHDLLPLLAQPEARLFERAGARFADPDPIATMITFPYEFRVAVDDAGRGAVIVPAEAGRALGPTAGALLRRFFLAHVGRHVVGAASIVVGERDLRMRTAGGGVDWLSLLYPGAVRVSAGR